MYIYLYIYILIMLQKSEFNTIQCQNSFSFLVWFIEISKYQNKSKKRNIYIYFFKIVFFSYPIIEKPLSSFFLKSRGYGCG